MRAIPIDNFFERLSGEDADRLDAASYDWGRIVSEGRAARTAADGGRWKIGGLALLVERRYASGAMQRFANEISESYGTVRRYRWVAKSYDPIVRERFASLSFSHFQSVAGLPDRQTWLERAARGSWSVDRLTRESRAKEARRAPTAVQRARRSFQQARTALSTIAELDEKALAHAGDEWLSQALDDLAIEVDAARDRVRRATKAVESRRPLSVARGKPVPKGKAPAELKARAIGR